MKAREALHPLGRLLVGTEMISAGIDKIRDPKGNMEFMKGKKMPAVPFFLAAAAGVEILGGLGLLLGVKGRISAGLLALYLIPVTALFSDFWNEKDEGDRKMKLIDFSKNMGIIGGLLEMASREDGVQSVEKPAFDMPSESEIIPRESRIHRIG